MINDEYELNDVLHYIDNLDEYTLKDILTYLVLDRNVDDYIFEYYMCSD